MDEHDDMQERNMISNLPLLFANGYPTSLDRISEKQLENFIPFMVQCSLGHINLIERLESSEPEWWPEDVPFTIPLMKPKKFSGLWMEKMKEIVLICYQFHKSVFLLRFCNDLSSYEHACLRFINNCNSTTSLYDRRSNKLLVTFRNENMSYDQPQRSRKCLLQQKSKNLLPSQEVQQMMVEPAPFDIYLCDNCDAELYSKEAILEHEKTCLIEDDDDDVILCDSPEPVDTMAASPHSQPQLHFDTAAQDDELRRLFLLNFHLQHRDAANLKRAPDATQTSDGLASHTVADDMEPADSAPKKRRPPRRNRPVHILTRSPIIPISSPAGQILQRITKTMTTQEYLEERQDRLERFCQAGPIQNAGKPKYFERKSTSNPHCTFKKPLEYSAHLYTFPRKQYSQRRRVENVQFVNSELLKRCRPISVRLKKITDQEVRANQPPPGTPSSSNSSCSGSFSGTTTTSSTNTKLNIRLKRDAAQSSNWKISSASSAATSAAEIIVDTIDLCSSDDDDDADADTEDSVTTAHTLTIEGGNRQSLFITGAVGNDATTPTHFQVKSLHHPQIFLNQPEITIIPLRKTFSNCAMQPDTVRKSPNVNKSTNSQYDNVLQTATSPSLGADVAIDSAPKPLRPSVFILSNVNRPNSSLVTNANDAVAASNASFTNQNQENLLLQQHNPTPVNSAFSNKHANNNNNNPSTLSVAEWFPESSNANPSTNRSQNARSVVQTFGSPNRVISIDLTF